MPPPSPRTAPTPPASSAVARREPRKLESSIPHPPDPDRGDGAARAVASGTWNPPEIRRLGHLESARDRAARERGYGRGGTNGASGTMLATPRGSSAPRDDSNAAAGRPAGAL